MQDGFGRVADIFIGMVRGNRHLPMALGVRPPLSHQEIREIVEAKVDIFLKGVAARR